MEVSVLQNRENSISDIVSSITDKLDDYKKEEEYHDDIALLCMRIK
jgi:serine phosphatase RsbU (regulator of sigma subunit)